MNRRQAGAHCVGMLIVPLLLTGPFTFNGSNSYAETYIAGQFGVTLPSVLPSAFDNGLTNGDLRGVFVPGSTISDQSLQRSVLYGGKIGHYFSAARWFGVEAEIYNTTPHIKQQSITFSGPAGPAGALEFPGLNFRVLTIAPFNLTVRYHKTRLQPYVGVGPGIFLARIEDPALTSNNTQSSTKLGLNAFAGIRYYITRHLTVFGEGKFNHVRFNFDETPPGLNFNMFGFDATYNVFHASFGISYHF